MKYIILSICLLNCLLSNSQDFKFSFPEDEFNLVLEKVSYEQAFYVSKNFPTNWIDTKWNNGYNIETISFKNNQWFVVVNKYKIKHKQVFLTNPSQKQLNEKSKDGYVIRDICLYEFGENINRIYAMVKISKNPINNYYTVGKSDKFSNTTESIKKAKTKNKICKNIKSIKSGNNIQFSYLAYGLEKIYENYDWLFEYRVDFPDDLIDNKKSQGYFLNSLTYDHYFKSWCIFMSKEKPIRVPANPSGSIYTFTEPKARVWELFNYRTEKDKIEEYINKGYSIISVN